MDTFLLILRVGLALTVVMVLLWMAQKRFTQGGRQRQQGVIEVVGRQSLGQKASVVVVESAGQRFLLGVTENAINVLHTSDAPLADPDTGLGDDPAFAEVLKAAGELPLRRDAGAAGARRLHRPQNAGALHGSIFARSTWLQAGAAVRKGLNL